MLHIHTVVVSFERLCRRDAGGHDDEDTTGRFPQCVRCPGSGRERPQHGRTVWRVPELVRARKGCARRWRGVQSRFAGSQCPPCTPWWPVSGFEDERPGSVRLPCPPRIPARRAGSTRCPSLDRRTMTQHLPMPHMPRHTRAFDVDHATARPPIIDRTVSSYAAELISSAAAFARQSSRPRA